MTHISEFDWNDSDGPGLKGGGGLDWHPPCTSWTTTFPVDPEDDSLAIPMGKPTRAELEQQIEDLKREVQFWKQMVDDVAEDYERELERLEDQRINVHVEPISDEALDLVSDLVAKSLRKHYRAL